MRLSGCAEAECAEVGAETGDRLCVQRAASDRAAGAMGVGAAPELALALGLATAPAAEAAEAEAEAEAEVGGSAAFVKTVRRVDADMG